jgi:uncharacterized lipoprotein NlpE involved in copper resistance
MKTSIYFLLAIGMLFHSCGSGESTETAAPDGDASTTEAPQTLDGHDSQNSLDWMGTYAGVLPCADCEELQIEVTLEEKSRYSRKMIYKGKSKTPLLSAGKFEWNEAGSEITLKSFKGNNQVYKVGENTLIFQMPEGDSGDYVLTKVVEKVEASV